MGVSDHGPFRFESGHVPNVNRVHSTIRGGGVVDVMPLIIIVLFVTWFVSVRLRRANDQVKKILDEVRGEAPSNRG